ncbi:hypothetical protein PFISCL1PPCAC_17879, partial [Pristionchus fissidentatus]
SSFSSSLSSLPPSSFLALPITRLATLRSPPNSRAFRSRPASTVANCGTASAYARLDTWAGTASISRSAPVVVPTVRVPPIGTQSASTPTLCATSTVTSTECATAIACH